MTIVPAVVTLWDQPHHDGSELHAPGAAGARLGDSLEVFLRVPRHPGTAAPTSVHLRQLADGEPRFAQASVHHVDAHDAWYVATLLVRNRLTRYRWLLADEGAGRGGYRWANAAGVSTHDVTDAADHILTTYPSAPDWAVDGVVYQVFPDRFARSGRPRRNVPSWAVSAGWDEPVEPSGPRSPFQLYGGDLEGVQAHLDHVVGLGATVLYLTPFFPANSTHRYDASTFSTVDPLLGGEAALARLVAAAHDAGLRVIGDLTTNHTGHRHEWFRAAQADAGAVEAGFYHFDRHPDRYDNWLGVPSLPKLNHASDELRRRLLDGPDSVVGRWLSGRDGLDGWRIDVANMTGRRGGDDLNHQVARVVRATMDEVRPDGFLLAEHFHDSSADVTVGAGGWHSVMNYAAFTRPVWEWLSPTESAYRFLGLPVRVPRKPTADVAAAMRQFAAAVPWQQSLQNVNLLGSHDTPRPLSVLGSTEGLLAAALVLFAYPGIPMVFAGDELGLTGDDGEHSRTPMPWDDEERFTGHIHRSYRELLTLRRSHPALRRGGLRWLSMGPDHMAWLRETRDERLAVIVARAATSLSLPATLIGRTTTLWGEADIRRAADLVHVHLSGPGGVVLDCR